MKSEMEKQELLKKLGKLADAITSAKRITNEQMGEINEVIKVLESETKLTFKQKLELKQIKLILPLFKKIIK